MQHLDVCMSRTNQVSKICLTILAFFGGNSTSALCRWKCPSSLSEPEVRRTYLPCLWIFSQSQFSGRTIILIFLSSFLLRTAGQSGQLLNRGVTLTPNLFWPGNVRVTLTLKWCTDWTAKSVISPFERLASWHREHSVRKIKKEEISTNVMTKKKKKNYERIMLRQIIKNICRILYKYLLREM